jgi:hypothetical protein
MPKRSLDQLQLDWVAKENIARFERKLKTATSIADRKDLESLIARERKKLKLAES